MWSAITQVTTGVTLIAFIVAVTAWNYRSSLLYRARLIESTPASERAALVERALDLMLLDSAGLTKEQKYLLARRQIAARERRVLATAVLGSLIAMLLAALAAYAIAQMAGTPAPSCPTSGTRQERSRGGDSSPSPSLDPCSYTPSISGSATTSAPRS